MEFHGIDDGTPGQQHQRSATILRRRWTRAVTATLLLDVVLCWGASYSRHHFTWSLLFSAIPLRIVGALTVGALMGWLCARMGRSLLASSIGLLVSDAAWIKILTGLGEPSAFELLANPTSIMLVLICPVSAAANRVRTFRIGLSMAVGVPLCFAAWILISISMRAEPGELGTGLAQAMTVIVTFGVIVVGVSGIVASRYLIDAVERHFAPDTQPVGKTIAKKIENQRGEKSGE